MMTLDTSALYAIIRADDDHHDRLVAAPDANPNPYLGAVGIP
jgi:predicted nucleic acid-binding protein